MELRMTPEKNEQWLQKNYSPDKRIQEYDVAPAPQAARAT
jgi:hypothetical protein